MLHKFLLILITSVGCSSLMYGISTNDIIKKELGISSDTQVQNIKEIFHFISKIVESQQDFDSKDGIRKTISKFIVDKISTKNSIEVIELLKKAFIAEQLHNFSQIMTQTVRKIKNDPAKIQTENKKLFSDLGKNFINNFDIIGQIIKSSKENGITVYEISEKKLEIVKEVENKRTEILQTNQDFFNEIKQDFYLVEKIIKNNKSTTQKHQNFINTIDYVLEIINKLNTTKIAKKAFIAESLNVISDKKIETINEITNNTDVDKIVKKSLILEILQNFIREKIKGKVKVNETIEKFFISKFKQKLLTELEKDKTFIEKQKLIAKIKKNFISNLFTFDKALEQTIETLTPNDPLVADAKENLINTFSWALKTLEQMGQLLDFLQNILESINLSDENKLSLGEYVLNKLSNPASISELLEMGIKELKIDPQNKIKIIKTQEDINFTQKHEFNQYIICGKIKEIPNYRFEYCNNLTNLLILSKHISIGVRAFQLCYQLKSATFITETITIEEGAFYHCQSLENFKILSNTVNIKNSIFFRCPKGLKVTYSKPFKGLDGGKKPEINFTGDTKYEEQARKKARIE